MTYETLDPATKDVDVTLSGGDLSFAIASGKTGNAKVHNARSSGQTYCELTVGNTGDNGKFCNVGVIDAAHSMNTPVGQGTEGRSLSMRSGGSFAYNNGSFASYGGAIVSGDVIGIAVDLDSVTKTVEYFKNGSSLGVAFSDLSGFSWLLAIGANSAGGAMSGYVLNFGATAFAHTPPTGFDDRWVQ